MPTLFNITSILELNNDGSLLKTTNGDQTINISLNYPTIV